MLWNQTIALVPRSGNEVDVGPKRYSLAVTNLGERVKCLLQLASQSEGKDNFGLSQNFNFHFPKSDVGVFFYFQAEEQIKGFLDDPDEKKLDFPPADQVYRSIL